MNYDYPHCLLGINLNAEVDETFFEHMHRCFVWANEMGLQGKKVFGLRIVTPPFSGNPLRYSHRILCNIQCTKEEKDLINERNEINKEHIIRDLLEE